MILIPKIVATTTAIGGVAVTVAGQILAGEDSHIVLSVGVLGTFVATIGSYYATKNKAELALEKAKALEEAHQKAKDLLHDKVDKIKDDITDIKETLSFMAGQQEKK
jgi:prefoldin subunit 5